MRGAADAATEFAPGRGPRLPLNQLNFRGFKRIIRASLRQGLPTVVRILFGPAKAHGEGVHQTCLPVSARTHND